MFTESFWPSSEILLCFLIQLSITGSVADPDRFGPDPDPDPTSENRPDPDPDSTK